MFLPRKSAEIDWPGFWANLLQGVGAGLLHYDGSPIAQAALAGLEAFDAAEEKRDRRKSQSPPSGPGHRTQTVRSVPWPDMSPAELAAYQRLSLEDQMAFDEEAAELKVQEGRAAKAYRPHGGRAPASPNPYEGSALEALLPFGKDGRLNVPIYRR